MPGPRKINKGQRLTGIPADSWNGFVDTYHKVAQLRPPGHSPAQVAADDRSVIVKLRNDSGSDAPTGGVLKLGAPIVLPATRSEVVLEGLLFTGETPAANEQHVAIVSEPIPDGAIGFGVIPGAAWAQVNVSNAAHTFAKPKASVAELESDSGTGFPIIWKESGTGAGKWAVVKLVSPGDTGNVIYAQVNKAGGVSTSDPTFPFDNAMPVVGQLPSGGTGTAQNQYAQAYLDNEWVFLFENKLTGQWLTERGGLSGSQVVHFELTQDMSYADVSTLAVPVLADGTADFSADEFWVVDIKGQFYGKTATGGEDGYRGMALRFTEDWNSSGVPGFRIIDMEGPAHWFIATLTEAWSMGSTNCSVGPDQIWGRPDRGVRLPATGDVAVFDDLSVATGGAIGDRWLAAWDEADEHYIFVVPLTAPGANLVIGLATVTIGAASMDGSLLTITPGITTAAVTKMQWSGAGLIADGSAIHGVNFSKTAIRASILEPMVVVGAIKTDIPDIEESFIIYSIYDLRMLPGLAISAPQSPYKPASNIVFELDGENCPE